MTIQSPSETWRILASSSRYFPVQAQVVFLRKEPGAPFEFQVNWEDEITVALFTGELPQGAESGTFQGEFEDKKCKPLLVVVTACPAKKQGEKRHLCGRLFDLDSPSRDGGALGVWVAEEERPPTDPGGCT